MRRLVKHGLLGSIGSCAFVLAATPGRAWTRNALADRVFGIGHDALDRTIDVHIMNLRRKIGSDRRAPALVETVFGVGYRFRDVNAE